ncbi:MAG: restriction endonuclease subunit S [Pseudomonadota bacterium]|nr:restriction endonuclease subunit S [Pseudomonadota bacterium]
MSEWTDFKIENLCDVGSSKRIKMADYVKSGVPFFRSKEIIELSKGNSISTELFITQEQFKSISDKFGHPSIGDILLTSVGTLGVPYHVEAQELPFYFKDGNLTWFKNFRNVINSRWLYYWLLSPQGKNKINEISIGSTQRAITIVALKGISLKVPSIENQNSAVSILDSITHKIENNWRMNATLEEMAQAIFKSWFVDFDPVHAKMEALKNGGSEDDARIAAMCTISGKSADELSHLKSENAEAYNELATTADAFPSAFTDSPLGQIPEGWEVKPLKSYLTIKRGGSPRPIKDYISKNGLPWLKIADATAECSPYIFETKEFIKEEGLRKTVLLKKGALILSNSATPGLPKFLELDTCVHDGWLHFPKVTHFTNEYLYFLFLKLRNEFIAMGNGSVFTNLKTDIVKDYEVVVADQIILNKFTEIARLLLNQVLNSRKQNQSLAETRDALLPKLLSGEVDVSQVQFDEV